MGMCFEGQCADGSCLGYKDIEFVRTLFHGRVLIPSKQNLHKCSWERISRGFNQYASQILDLEQFAVEEAERTPSVKKMLTITDQILPREKTHKRESKCASPTKVQPPRDQRKQAVMDKATIPVKAALRQRGLPVILMAERV